MVIADIRKATAKGHTALVCWHGDDDNFFSHWVCVAGFTGGGRVILFDPNLTDVDLDPPAFSYIDEDYAPSFMSLARFRAWLVPDEELDDDGDPYHFFMELWPAEDSRDRFVKGMVTEELLQEMRRDDELITCFDEYIDDLRDIFGVPSTIEGGERACEFLERHRNEILATVGRWTLADCVPRSYYEREIKSVLALTRCYEFRVEPGKEAEVMRDLGFYLGWRACEYTFEVGRYED